MFFFSNAEIVCVLFKGTGKSKAIDANRLNGGILDNIDDAVDSLIRLRDKISRDEDFPAPEFLMVLCATAPMSYVRSDGVYVVPIDCLGP